MASENIEDTPKSILDDKDFFELRLEDLVSILYKNTYLILLIIFISGLISVAYSLSIKDIYKSNALLMVNEDKQSSTTINSSMMGLSQLAGINLQGSASSNKSIIAIKTLESKNFANALVKNNELLVGIMATKYYDKENKKIIIDNEIYDVKEGEWVREVSYPFLKKPSYIEFFDKYHNHISFDLNQKTGFIEVNSFHQSPFFAKKIIEITIQELNSITRKKDSDISDKSLDYLSQKSTSIKNNELLKSVSSLMESYIKTKMLSDIKDDYLITYIDPPYTPIYKDYPNRLMICITGVLIGLLISFFLIFLKEIILYRKNL
jgi:LPS O-antigen subunit length determinant protein (WzzB/FepE family)